MTDPAAPMTESLAREITDAVPLIVWTHDHDGKPTYVNRRWVDFTGLSLEDVQRASSGSTIHPDDRQRVLDLFTRSRASGERLKATYRLRSRDGSYRWHEVRVTPLHGSDADVKLWVGTASDVDDEHLAREEHRYLVEASTVLGSSLDVQRTLNDVARLIVPVLADWCSIDLLGHNGEIERAAVAHVDPSKVALAWELWKMMPPKPSDAHGVYGVMRTRTPEIVKEVTDEMLAAAIPDPQILELCRGLGLRSSICVPLIARDTVFGALSLVTAESAKPYTARNLAFAEEMARRIAIALDNARLYEQATRARAAAEAIAADVIEQSKAVAAELLSMRAERDAARAELERMRGASTEAR